MVPILESATGFSLSFAQKGTLFPALKGNNSYKNVDKHIQLSNQVKKRAVAIVYLFNKTNTYLSIRNVKILIILVLYWNLWLTKKNDNLISYFITLPRKIQLN